MQSKIPACFFVLLLLITGSPVEAGSAKPEHYSLPSGYVYIECTLYQCTNNELRAAATDYVYREGVGRYEFLLGNVAQGTLFLMTATLRDLCGREPGCTGGLTLFTSEAAPHSDVMDQFTEYSIFLKTYPGSIDIPADVTPTIATHVQPAAIADIQTWIVQHYPQFGRPNIFQRSVSLTLKFSDGSEGKYTFFLNVSSYKLTWQGIGKDADGNPITAPLSNDQSLRHEPVSGQYPSMIVRYNPLGAQADHAITGGYATVRLTCYQDGTGGIICKVRRV